MLTSGFTGSASSVREGLQEAIWFSDAFIKQKPPSSPNSSSFLLRLVYCSLFKSETLKNTHFENLNSDQSRRQGLRIVEEGNAWKIFFLLGEATTKGILRGFRRIFKQIGTFEVETESSSRKVICYQLVSYGFRGFLVQGSRQLKNVPSLEPRDGIHRIWRTNRPSERK